VNSSLRPSALLPALLFGGLLCASPNCLLAASTPPAASDITADSTTTKPAATSASITTTPISSLPDAPTPNLTTIATDDDTQQSATPQTTSQAGTLAPGTLQPGISPIAKSDQNVIEPGQIAPHLTPGDKMGQAAFEIIKPYSFAISALSAAYGQARNGDPKYGQGWAAYGQRFGAAFLRQNSSNFMADGIFDSILKQDPRYYRMAQGKFSHRLGHALIRTFVTKGDDGSRQGDYSQLLGQAIGSALTLAYYPARSANGRVVAETFGVSIPIVAVGYVANEFMPDILHKFHLDFLQSFAAR
jgi:hypothetical protein